MSGGGDHDIKLWDIESGHVTATLSGHTQEVVRSCNKTLLLSYQVTFFYQLCIQCTSYVIASASADSMVRLWNYYGTVSYVNQITVMVPNACLHSLHAAGRCLHILDGHIGVVRCLALLGDVLISGGDRKRIITWDLKVFNVNDHVKSSC